MLALGAGIVRDEVGAYDLARRVSAALCLLAAVASPPVERDTAGTGRRSI